MARGKVTQWNGQTGFLSDLEDRVRVFFGDRALRGISTHEIKVGMELEFDRGHGDKGPRANNVRPVGSTANNVRGNRAGGNRESVNQSRGRREDAPSQVHFRSESPATWVLPRDTQALIRGIRIEDRHPGIQLDRLSLPGEQVTQLNALEQYRRTTGDSGCFAEVAARRSTLLQTLTPHQCWIQKTSGPLTLHLSRSNALENAGLALHPVYGFAYLPGSGLKGMARAIARTELRLSDELIVEIFGNDIDNRKSENQRAGNVCFHDAWPVAWPKTFVDIVNNHHPGYYEGIDAPGDWESPNPVYFLAIEPDTAFSFVLSARRRDTSRELVGEAAKCLQVALSEAGAGAKTAAGYGWFRPLEPTNQPSLKRSLLRNLTLTLDSPAFLAGAERSKDDCKLRSASLRGQLRSWWRTLHAGCMSVDNLRALEASLWGDTKGGGAIRFTIEPTGNPKIDQYQHPKGGDSGVRYLAYGMDDGREADRQVRMVMNPGMTWTLKVRVRETKFDSRSIPRERVVEQFEASLRLLTRFGGVGAKSRKGFGSLSISGELASQDWKQWKQQSAELRSELEIDMPFSANLSESASLFDPDIQIIELKCSARSAIDALEQTGRAYKTVAGSYKHREEKVTLGLPRKIHGPTNKAMPHQNAANHKPPQWLNFPKPSSRVKPSDARHTSPIHLHLQKNTDNTWTIRAVLFPMKYLPSRQASIEFERSFAEAFKREFGQSAPTQTASRSGVTIVSRAQAQRTTGPQVEVTILEEKQLGGKVGFKVQEEGKRPGMLVDGVAPSTLPKIGDKAMVYWVTTSDANSPRYRWTPPTPNQPGKSGGRRH